MGKQDSIKQMLLRSAEIKTKVASDPAMLSQIEKAADLLIGAVKAGGTVYSCGNGGSSNDAMHLSEELVARYKRERPGIKAMHMMDAAVLTCWSNDYSFETVYERQVQTFCGPDDILVAISTSGNSPNILKAAEAARKKSTKVIGLTGKGGGKLAPLCDVALVIPADETERIQEMHITLIHIFCELIETAQ